MPLAAAADGSAPLSLGQRLRRHIATRQFLFVSVLVHLLLAGVATVLVVQTITAKRKLTFTAAPPTANPSTHAVEHRVQMAQKQKTMSAPAQAKRVTTLATNAKVTLPQMPAMPALDSVVTPAKMGGMGGAGFGLATAGAPGGVGGPGGGGVALFGLRTSSTGLLGTFYDLKQTPGKQSTKMNPGLYGDIVVKIVKAGFNIGMLSKYYKSDKPLYATMIWIPDIPADLGPAAFGLENEVKPSMWLVHYKGKVTAPASFTFHFVGAGDDIMLVKFDGKLVLDRCWYVRTGWKPVANYDYGFGGIPDGFAKGDAIEVRAGESYDMEVLIGEQPGGASFATLLQEVEGVAYDKDPKGNPILPVFRMADTKPAENDASHVFPPHRNDGPVWKASPSVSDEGFSVFQH